ncbi:MAG: hypothetical protein ACRENG_12715, partial [bacterium]
MPKTTGVTEPELAEGFDACGLEVSKDFDFAATDGGEFSATEGMGEIGASGDCSAFRDNALVICIVALSCAEFFNGDGLLDRAASGIF